MKFRNSIVVIVGCLCLIGIHNPLDAQERPPRPIRVSTFQGLNFGSFTAEPGDVTVSCSGVRTASTFDIMLLNSFYCPAIFEVDTEPGVFLTLMAPDAILYNTSGTGTMTLKFDSFYPGNPFVSSVSGITEIRIGGTLSMDINTITGSYNGEFFITFIQE